MADRLDELVDLTRRLGRPERDLAVLAEGNTSCQDEGGFWVKASGFGLDGIGPEGFVHCGRSQLIDAFDRPHSDEQVKNVLLASQTRPGPKPSVEAFMHAWLLGLHGVEFVAHVHPTAALAVLCTESASSYAALRFFPDEVVCCGARTAWVPYVDPGLKLAEAVRDSVTAFIDGQGDVPKVVWLQNHGVIALGGSTSEVESALVMNDKVCRIIAMSRERLVPLEPEQVERIRSRPDEHYRQELLWKLKAGR
ncbi:MAG: class II aldolase [Armatimonadetes bacterium]|nr:class II aldolase [Armatimonadota bacterium]